MTKNLLSLLKKPNIYKRSDELFWEDEHISKEMLALHLAPDIALASRTHKDIDLSCSWLRSIIKKDSKILDLGCGPGLYTKRLSDYGFNVVGIDYSIRSIDYAFSQDKKTKYIYQNYLDLDFVDEFDVVILIYCDYAALTFGERKILLSKIKKALKPNGLFIFDVFQFNEANNKDIANSWEICPEGGFWDSRGYTCLTATHKYENDTVQLNQYVVITDKTIKQYLIWNTLFSYDTLKQELENNGFYLKEAFGDVKGNAYSKDSQTICFISSINK